MAATLLVVAALAVQLTRAHLRSELDRRLASAVESFREGPAKRIDGPESLGDEGRKWLSAQAFPQGQVAAIRMTSGEVLTSSGGIDLRNVDESLTLLTASEAKWWNLESTSGGVRALTSPLLIRGNQEGTLVVAATEAEVDRTLSALLSRIAWSAALGSIFAAAVGYTAVRRTMRPLTKMSAEVEDIKDSVDLSKRIDYQGPEDEVGRLALAFNEMLSRLEGAFQTKRQFLADASHELRTPLTVARGRIELEAERDPEGRANLESSIDELDRMGRIVEDLLLLARLDEGVSLSIRPVELDLIVREAILRGLRGNQTLHSPKPRVQVEPGLYVLADPDRLLQVMTNLVTNVLKHAGPQASLSIEASSNESRVSIEVVDDGSGIPPEELPLVFERFFRGKSSQPAASGGGSGLGLAIVASLVKAMGGATRAESEPGEETRITVELPKAQAPN